MRHIKVLSFPKRCVKQIIICFWNHNWWIKWTSHEKGNLHVSVCASWGFTLTWQYPSSVQVNTSSLCTHTQPDGVCWHNTSTHWSIRGTCLFSISTRVQLVHKKMNFYQTVCLSTEWSEAVWAAAEAYEQHVSWFRQAIRHVEAV